MGLKQLEDVTYFRLNNEINRPINGQIMLHKDKEALEAFFKEKYEEHPEKTILAVCHGGLIRSFLTQKGIKEVGRGVIVNTSVSVLEYDGNKFELIEFNK